MDPRLAKRRAESMRREIVGFLRDLISIPSLSCEEGPVARRIQLEMDRLGFDEARIDRMGNVIGRVGKGKRAIVLDSHIDTVGIGDPSAWDLDPHGAVIQGNVVYGRGASDNKNGVVSQLFGATIAHRLGLPPDISIYVVGTVQEEDCDGLALERVLTEEIPKAECVVLGEATDLKLYRGHRGRMEIQVRVPGVSCHASAPERGENALYRASEGMLATEELNQKLAEDDFLGKGSIAATHLESHTGSLNTVPNLVTLYLDRRLTAGEDRESALAEVQEAFGEKAQVSVLRYEAESHTRFPCAQEKYFPTWSLPEDHPLVQVGQTARESYLAPAPSGRWVFSTNGVASMGKLGIPTIGFGPGREEHAHSVEDQLNLDDLVIAAAFYGLLPTMYAENTTKRQMRRLKVDP